MAQPAVGKRHCAQDDFSFNPPGPDNMKQLRSEIQSTPNQPDELAISLL
jgi:hypothetical protein